MGSFTMFTLWALGVSSFLDWSVCPSVRPSGPGCSVDWLYALLSFVSCLFEEVGDWLYWRHGSTVSPGMRL